MPIVIVRGSHISPAPAHERPKEAGAGDQLGERGIGTSREEVPEEDQRESWTGSDGNKDLENRALGVSITDSRGDGREPLVGIAIVFVLDDLVEVQARPHNQRAQEGCVSHTSMRMSNPFPVDLDQLSACE